ncbi:unnamed protein product [Sympodiomycopsis kandeliae]
MPRRKQSKAAGGLVIKKVAGPLKDLFDRQALNVKQKTKAADEELLPMLDHKTKNSAQTNFKSNLAHGISDIVPRITTKHQINISEAAIDLISSSDSELSATDHEGYDHSREFTPLFPDHDSNYDTHQMNNLKSLLPNGDDALSIKRSIKTHVTNASELGPTDDERSRPVPTFRLEDHRYLHNELQKSTGGKTLDDSTLQLKNLALVQLPADPDLLFWKYSPKFVKDIGKTQPTMNSTLIKRMLGSLVIANLSESRSPVNRASLLARNGFANCTDG